jgi:uncharacterized protein YdhG (YjbR/CyaY superfamily)
MRSSATTVTEFLAELPAERKAAMTKLRAVVRKAAPDAAETMQYGMPTYELDGMLCAFASQKNYMAFYGDSEIVDAHRAALGKLDCGKGCIRFRKLEDLPLETIGTIVKEARAKRGKAS